MLVMVDICGNVEPRGILIGEVLGCQGIDLDAHQADMMISDQRLGVVFEEA